MFHRWSLDRSIDPAPLLSFDTRALGSPRMGSILGFTYQRYPPAIALNLGINAQIVRNIKSYGLSLYEGPLSFHLQLVIGFATQRPLKIFWRLY